MKIDISSALEAGTEPKLYRSWFDRLPEDIQKQLKEVKSSLDERHARAKVSRNIHEQLLKLHESGVVPVVPAEVTIRKWIST